jgi:heme/copper-type cytochrome/quinol oxidase subunit 2
VIVFLVISLLILALVFGLSSASQSYATAKQAQATIETARAAEIASTGNLIAILLFALLMIVVIGVSLYFILRFKTTSQQHSQKSTQSHIAQVGPLSLDSVLTQLVIQMLQNQMEQNVSQLHIPPAQIDTSTEDNDLWLLP